MPRPCRVRHRTPQAGQQRLWIFVDRYVDLALVGWGMDAHKEMLR